MDFSQMNIYKSKNKKRKLANEDDDEDNAEQKIKYNITTHGNEIYFYEDIYKEQILELINQIKNITFELEYISIKYNVKPVIHLHIYSNGGDAFMGLLMVILLVPPHLCI
jgi:ATP-dependent protease ClpP protease subunit